MRMWMINPAVLCRKHLLGEHSEIHKHRHNFVKRHSIAGRIEAPGGPQIEPLALKRRHDDLATEMLRRGYRHESPYAQPDLRYLPATHLYARVDRWRALQDLADRCADCRSRIEARGYDL